MCLTHDNHLYIVTMEETEMKSLDPRAPVGMYKMKLEGSNIFHKALVNGLLKVIYNISIISMPNFSAWMYI